MTYEELERYVERLPELYAKHNCSPMQYTAIIEEERKCCALGIIAMEVTGDFSDAYHILGWNEGYQFRCGFDDGEKDSRGKFYALGRRAAEIVGLRSTEDTGAQ